MTSQPPPIPPRTQNDPEQHATQEQVGVYTKTMKMYNNMKIAVFTFSLLKIIIVQLSLLFVEEEESIDRWNTIEIVAFALTGSLLGIVTIILFLYGTYKQICSMCVEEEEEEEINPLVLIAGTFMADLLMLIANWSYFIGDKITNFYNIQSENASKYRYTSQYLLVIGLAGFVFVPRFKKIVQKYYTEDNGNEDVAKAQNFISNAIAIILEIDALYTILTNTTLECNTTESGFLWCIWATITIMLIIYFIVQVIRVITQMENGKTKINVIAVTASLVIVAAFFLLMDNNKPLNCSGAIKCTVSNTNSNTANIPGPHCNHNNTTRFIMTIFTTFIYGPILFQKILLPTIGKKCKKSDD
uniref:Uncharacterized protein n=1 Tax=Amphimedon queenslandica TaxID=400682 RepID=A0A1X7U014_AMPQE